MFSILIASWNNLDYLKLCVESIEKYSAVEHEIIIHVNDGSDGTLDWVRSRGFKYSHSSRNIGVCLAYNRLAEKAKHDWLVLLNDDMVCCPGWDAAYVEAIRSAPTTLALFSSTLIEPRQTGNDLVVVADYGRTPEAFDENRMLDNYLAEERPDIAGRTSQPTVIHRKWWHIVGGYSIEFGPGMSSDNDLWMKLWVAGCRHYKILGSSRLYHFSQVSTGRLRRNKGGRTFLLKWGITQKEFSQQFMLKSASVNEPDAIGLPQATLAGRLKRFVYSFLGGRPLSDLKAWEPAPGRYLGDFQDDGKI